jgi:hypothetical protein
MDRDSLLVGFHDEQSSYNFHNTPSRLLIDEPLHDTLDELRVPRAAARNGPSKSPHTKRRCQSPLLFSTKPSSS